MSNFDFVDVALDVFVISAGPQPTSVAAGIVMHSRYGPMAFN